MSVSLEAPTKVFKMVVYTNVVLLLPPARAGGKEAGMGRVGREVLVMPEPSTKPSAAVPTPFAARDASVRESGVEDPAVSTRMGLVHTGEEEVLAKRHWGGMGGVVILATSPPGVTQLVVQGMPPSVAVRLKSRVNSIEPLEAIGARRSKCVGPEMG